MICCRVFEVNAFVLEQRLRVRQEHSRSLIIEFEAWLCEWQVKLSRNKDMIIAQVPPSLPV
ncbi:hypothetical protein CO683_40690 [Bradyrhizobium ottawaense]|nr:hypothetical protein CO683_40690 [Bradyrhizobium ottawaense]